MRGFLNNILTMARGCHLPPGKPLNATAKPLVPSAPMTAKHAQIITKLRGRLNHLDISQADFAVICDVHPNTVSNWARGRTRINRTALAFLEQIEASADLRRRLQVDVKATGAPRGKPFAKGNVYRFGDRRRRVAIAGTHLARAAA